MVALAIGAASWTECTSPPPPPQNPAAPVATDVAAATDATPAADAHTASDAGDTIAIDAGLACTPFVPGDAGGGDLPPADAAAFAELGKSCPMGCSTNMKRCADTKNSSCANQVCVYDVAMKSGFCSVPCGECPEGYACKKEDFEKKFYCFKDSTQHPNDFGKPCKPSVGCSDRHCATSVNACASGICATVKGLPGWVCTGPCLDGGKCACGYHCAQSVVGATAPACFPDGTECKKHSDCPASSEFCKVPRCVNGLCELRTPQQGDADHPCKSPDACKVGSCDGLQKKCSTVAVKCDDGDPCTTDNCDAKTGCTFAKAAACCGDAVCGGGETAASCPIDCTPGGGTCAYRCGEPGLGGCSCAKTCETNPTGCCPDYKSACTGNFANSCAHWSCKFPSSPNGSCSCEPKCAQDTTGCCLDYFGACVGPKPAALQCTKASPCFGKCDGQFAAGDDCACSAIAKVYGKFDKLCASAKACCE